MRQKLAQIKAVLLDWDGVFHSGHKNELKSSTFSEADSMGVNMLRFGIWLQQNKMPFVGIISGEDNVTARFWAAREHVNATFSNVKNKSDILPYLKEHHQIQPHEILFVYDDILDLSLAKEVGSRVLINRNANPLFVEYCREKGWYDYITHNDGGNHGLREACEMVLDAMGKFEETIDKRIEFAGDYSTYNAQRLAIESRNYLQKGDHFIPW